MDSNYLLPQLLIDEAGELKKEALTACLEERDWDPHVLRRLKMLEEPHFFKLIRRFQKPLCHRRAEDLVRETLGSSEPLTDALIRRAVLAALFSRLRQNVGSCFATAPAILIHEEQPQQFLADLYELLMTGRLKRTFGGVEYVVPLCPSQALAKKGNPLLKAWEYTLASFSEAKMEFSGWNLYASLGLNPEEEGGIGELLYNTLVAGLEGRNQELLKYQAECEGALRQLNSLEHFLREAATEAEGRRLKAEAQGALYHLRACEELRDEAHAKASLYSSLLPFLIEQYKLKFPLYFQEIYDPDMHELLENAYDDSPAGFRLLYKHGRSDASLWTFIYNADQYIEMLIDFFLAIEPQISAERKPLEKELAELTTAIVLHLRTKEFLSSAMKRTHRIFAGETARTPWSYTSGGTMDLLLKTYFRREGDFAKEGRWVESATDLLLLLLDTLKALPLRVTQRFLQSPEKGMLMHSPTHAFILHPGWKRFKEAWQDNGFTYTWVRDQFLLPAKDFYEEQKISPTEQRQLLDSFSFPTAVTPREFREKMLDFMPADQADSLLYSFLWERAQKMKISFPGLLLFADTNWQEEYTERDSRTGFGPPRKLSRINDRKPVNIRNMDRLTIVDSRGFGQAENPILESRSVYFSFVINPGTGVLELWRAHFTGSRAVPMSAWKVWLQGKDKIPWLLYTDPDQYKA